MKKREDYALWNGLFIFEKWSLVVLMGAVASVMFAVAALRYVSIQTLGFEEFVVFFAIWLYFIGAAYTSRTKSHMAADFIDSRFKKPKTKSLLALYRRVATVILNGILLLWACQYLSWQIQLNPKTPFFELPLVINYIGIVVGLLYVMVYECIYLYDNVKDCHFIFSRNSHTTNNDQLQNGVR